MPGNLQIGFDEEMRRDLRQSYFRFYKYQASGKKILGFEEDNYVKDVHDVKSVEWGKIK